jgi:hypothetical protein
MQCFECGSCSVGEAKGLYIVQSGEKTRVVDDVRMECARCGNMSYVGEQISRHERACAAAIREMDGLLSVEDLVQFRTRSGRTQGEMDSTLALRSGTWARWERGAVCQNRAQDDLIRSLISSAGF